MKIYPVVMAGGHGTRLWPLSRSMHPKQFLNMHGDNSMLQATVKRLSKLNIESPIIICNEEHRFFVAEQLREISSLGPIILEPVGRNTAAAAALAAFSAEEDPMLLVLAADHVIQDEGAFTKTIGEAIPLANAGHLVTFGIVPTEPHTGYGYIKRGKPQGNGYTIEEFVEKPSADIAQQYISSDCYYWNSGMFLFKASKYLEELEKFRPEIHKACKAAVKSVRKDGDFIRIDKDQFASSPSDSIDYAVMENTSDAVVVPLEANWSDIGSWSSLWDVSQKDINGNFSSGDVILHDVKNSYIKTDDKLVAAIGLEDLVIISTKDVLMVANKSNVQDVKIIAGQLQEQGRPEWEYHREVYRPWGKYDSLDKGPTHQVKRITVKPGAKLSVQMHHHRSEHWVVVSGLARVTKGEDSFLLNENQSTYIPVGVIHSLENVGIENLELIEVQSGSYLGEDDIVRFDDKYGRI